MTLHTGLPRTHHTSLHSCQLKLLYIYVYIYYVWTDRTTGCTTVWTHIDTHGTFGVQCIFNFDVRNFPIHAARLQLYTGVPAQVHGPLSRADANSLDFRGVRELNYSQWRFSSARAVLIDRYRHRYTGSRDTCHMDTCHMQRARARAHGPCAPSFIA